MNPTKQFENMTSYDQRFVNLFKSLVSEQADFSQATFGSDRERGPVGPLKHLEKEAKEAQEHPTDRSEYADCMLLILDAARRAGISPPDLVQEAYNKLQKNKVRQWPAYEPWNVEGPCIVYGLPDEAFTYRCAAYKGIHTIVKYHENPNRCEELVYEAIRQYNLDAMEHVR